MPYCHGAARHCNSKFSQQPSMLFLLVAVESVLRLSRLAAFHHKKWMFLSYIRSAAVVVLTGGCPILLQLVFACVH